MKDSCALIMGCKLTFTILFWFWQNQNKTFFVLQWCFDLSKQKVLVLVLPKLKQNREGQVATDSDCSCYLKQCAEDKYA